MTRDKDLYESISSDTIKRAEEMCSSLSADLFLERRGQTTYYEGAISDMSDMSGSNSRFTKVTVAESGKTNMLTVISKSPLPESKKALLVYRLAPGQDMKYLGRNAASRPGTRQDDDSQAGYFSSFDIIQDVRKR